MRTQTPKRSLTLREREILKRCIIFAAGALFFFTMAAIRANAGDYYRVPAMNSYGQHDMWLAPDDDDNAMSDDDYIMAARMTRQVVGPRPVYNRRKASQPHDSVTIVINENTASEIASSNDLKRNSSNNLNVQSLLFPKILGTRQWNAENGNAPKTIDYSNGRAHKSDSTIERTQYFRATLTGKVIDVQPNGYLVIEARKTVNVNGEEQVVILTGIVNPDHMDSNSSIFADRIMDLYVKYDGAGPMSRMDKRGWGSKVIDFLNPF
jgi:Flagellar basal body L-ring protein